MDIRNMEYFVEVCRCLSFTKAAANLYISQQGMSKSIKRLEEELGVQLFRRSTSSIELTEYAECLLPYAKEIVRNWHMTVNSLETLKSASSGMLRVGIPHGLVNIFPASILRDFSRQNKRISISMGEHSDYELDNVLLTGGVDVALCVMPVDEGRIAIHHVHRENTFYMVGENHPLASRDTLDLAELKDEVFMGFGVKNKGHAVFIERCRKAGFDPHFGIMSQDMNMIMDLCRSGLGIGFYVGDPNRKIDGIKIIPDVSWEWAYDIGVCTLRSAQLSGSAKKFINALKVW